MCSRKEPMATSGGGSSLRAVFARLGQRLEEYAALSDRVWGGDTEVGLEEVSAAEEGVAGELRRGEELCRAQSGSEGQAQERNNRARLSEARADFERQRRRMREGLERRELFGGVQTQ